MFHAEATRVRKHGPETSDQMWHDILLADTTSDFTVIFGHPTDRRRLELGRPDHLYHGTTTQNVSGERTALLSVTKISNGP